MAFAREIFIQIKNVIRFQQSEKESDSHYTVLGNTLVRVSNHCTYMYVWENFFKIHPKQRGMKILSLVFEDNKDTFHPNCLVTQHNLSKPIMVEEYVYPLHSNPQYLSKVDVNAIIKSLQNLERTNRFNEPTGKAQRYVRKSLNPTTQNITTDNSGIPTFSSEFGYGDDAVSESKNNESKTNKNMKKNVVKLNENTIRKIVAESVKKVLKEYEDRSFNSGEFYGEALDAAVQTYLDSLNIEPRYFVTDTEKIGKAFGDKLFEIANQNGNEYGKKLDAARINSTDYHGEGYGGYPY